MKLENSDEFFYQASQFCQKIDNKVEFVLNNDCNEKILKVSSALNGTSFGGALYVKDPCLTLLVILSSNENPRKLLENHVKYQPYIFALQASNSVSGSWNLLEVQFFSKKILHISTWKQNKWFNKPKASIDEQRQDFNGSPLRFVRSNDVNYDARETLEILSIIKNQYNFTLKEAPFEGYGLEHFNQNWSGSIRQIIHDEIDVGSLKVTLTNERLNLVEPGYVITEEFTAAVFNKQLMKGFLAWNSILTAFHELVYLFITVFMFFLSFILAYSSNIGLLPFQWLMALISSTKSLFAQPFNETIFIGNHYKWSKRLQVLTISILGAFLFWCFSGVLTSLLAIPSSNTPIKSMDDLKDKHGLKLVVLESKSYIRSYMNKWAKLSAENEDIFQERVIITKDWIGTINELQKDMNAIVLLPSLGLPTLFEEFRKGTLFYN